MGQHKLFEAQSVFGIKIVQRLPLISDASCVRTREPAILFSTGALLGRTCKERNEPGEFGIREAPPRSGWTQARSMAARATPKPSRAASSNGTCRA